MDKSNSFRPWMAQLNLRTVRMNETEKLDTCCKPQSNGSPMIRSEEVCSKAHIAVGREIWTFSRLHLARIVHEVVETRGKTWKNSLSRGIDAPCELLG